MSQSSSLRDHITKAAAFDEARVETASESERIYEPKYGGKDHSGYETMMKYEINYERMEAFENGAKWENARLRPLIEALADVAEAAELVLDAKDEDADCAAIIATGDALARLSAVVGEG